MDGFACDNCGSFCTYASAKIHVSQRSKLNKQYCVQCCTQLGLVPVLVRSCRLPYCSGSQEFGEFCTREHAFYFYKDRLNLNNGLIKHLEDAVDVTLGEYESLVMYLEFQLHKNTNYIEKLTLIQESLALQQETGLCQYTQTNAPFQKCLNPVKCVLHADWHTIALNRLNLEFQVEPYTCPDPQFVKNKQTEPASVSLYDENVYDSTKVSICKLAYVWESDKDYNLFNDPEPFLQRHYHTTKLFKKSR